MTRLRFFSFFVLSAFSLLVSVYAAPVKQTLDPEQHYVYLDGIDYEDGKYIKAYFSYENATEIFCWLGGSALSSYISTPGTYTNRYFICTDVLGTQCEPLSSDVYTVAKQNDNLVVNPQVHAIDLSKVASKYPSCGFNVMKGKQKIQMIKR